ncbi:hypothetical protein T439DRAFT_381412 [Meredithblackwellia eburnea MCA 4105]
MATYASQPHPYAVVSASIPPPPPPASHDSPTTAAAASTSSHPPPAPPPTTALPPLPSGPPPSRTRDSLSYNRERGESSPVQSYRDSREGDALRRKSSSLTPRRIIDGREETKEERRIRKEKERLERGEDPSSPSTRHRSRSSRSRDLPPSPSSPPDFLPLSPTSPTSTNGTITAAATPTPRSPPASSSGGSASAVSSKSVLTIALQRAQSAVLLDSANNVPAAIAAYTQSVRLLKDVMMRVEEGSRREREREREVREGETEEQLERRRVRNERREKMKVDEARRLKVIHDTYEDRIKMLLAMGPSGGGSPTSPLSGSSTPPSSNPPTPTTFQTTSTPPFTPRPVRHQQTPSNASLATTEASPAVFSTPLAFSGTSSVTSSASTSSSSTIPVTSGGSPSPAGGRNLPALTLNASGPPHRTLNGQDDDDWSEGIGSAMLLASPPASPMDPMMPGRSRTTPSPTSAGGSAQDLFRTTTQLPLRSSPPLEERGGEPGTEDEEVLRYMNKEREGNALAASEEHRRSNDAPSPSPSSGSVSSAHQQGWLHGGREAPQEEEDDEDLVPVEAINFGFEGNVEDADADIMSTSADSSSSFLAGDALPRRNQSLETNWLGLAHSSSPPLRTPPPLPLDGAITMAEDRKRSSASEERRGSAASAKQDPLPPLPPRDEARRRTVEQSRMLLVNETTEGGTISQRRKSPSPQIGSLPNGGWEPRIDAGPLPGDLQQDVEGAEDDDPTLRPASIVVRPASSDSHSYEFGQSYPVNPPHSASASISGSYVSSSLPTRLRTISQPGKRPPLGTFESAPPALPQGSPQTGLVVSTRSSSSGPNFGRKSSVPTPTALYAPPLPGLNRTNSHSSQGSLSDREGLTGISPRLPSPNPSVRAETPMSATFSRFPAPSTSTAGPPTSSLFLANPPPPEPTPTFPLPPLRRPFHLMRQICQSIESGAYITPRLYVPKQMWSQAGVKLVAVETKVRMLDLLLTGLEGADKAGEGLVRLQGFWEGVRAKEGAAAFAKELEDLEGLMSGIQSTLAKKLGYGSSGKKTTGASFSAWSSKISRSLDRVTNGRSLDSPATYVESISRVFRHAQSIDNHLVALAVADGGYGSLESRETQRIEKGLRRASDFFGQVICQFILRDLGIFLDKYVKRGGAWVGD